MRLMGNSFVYCLIFLGFLYKLGSYEMKAIVKFEEILLLHANKSNFVFYVKVVVNGGFWCVGRDVIDLAPEACTADTSSSNFAVIGQQLWVSILIDMWRYSPPVITPLFLAARVSYITLLVVGCLASREEEFIYYSDLFHTNTHLSK